MFDVLNIGRTTASGILGPSLVGFTFERKKESCVNEKRLAKVYLGAIHHAQTRGCAWCAEDFAQEATMRLSRGRKASFQQLLVDFLRRYGPLNRAQVKKAKENPNFDVEHNVPFDLVENEIPSPEPKLFDEFPIAQYLHHLSPKQKQVLTMYLAGTNLAEIGKLMGFSESRASQLLKGARIRLTEIVRLDRLSEENRLAELHDSDHPCQDA